MISYKFGATSLSRLHGVNPVMVEIMMEAIAVSPIDFGIPPDGGLRTAERQYELWLDGKSKADGTSKKSKHQSGNAIDVFAYVNGKASWNKIHLALIAGVVLAVAKKKGVKVKWGGTFGSSSFEGWDMPHFELIED